MGIDLSRYRHVVWDWNGTLIDDRRVCVEILNGSLRAYGLDQISEERYLAGFDFPVKDFYQRLGFDWERISYDKVAAEWAEQYEGRQFECELASKAREVLEQVQRLGLGQSVLSAYHEDKLIEAVRYYGLTRFFVKVLGQRDFYAHSKVQRGRELIEELGLRADKVLLVGDTVHDHEVAEALGCDCVLVADGHQFKDRLLGCGREVVDSISSIRF